MKTFCQLRDVGTADIVQSVHFFYKVRVGDSQEGCAISDRGGRAQK